MARSAMDGLRVIFMHLLTHAIHIFR
jgi:hypothetical protein